MCRLSCSRCRNAAQSTALGCTRTNSGAIASNTWTTRAHLLKQKKWSTTYIVHHGACLLTPLCSAAGMTELTSPSMATLAARVASHDMLLLDGSDSSMTVLAFWTPARHTADTTSSLLAGPEEPSVASTCSSQHRFILCTDECIVHMAIISDRPTHTMQIKARGALPPQGVHWQGTQRGGRRSCVCCLRRLSAACGRPAAAARGPPAGCATPGTAGAQALLGGRRCLEHCNALRHWCSVTSTWGF